MVPKDFRHKVDVAGLARGEGDLKVEHVLRHGTLIRVERAFERFEGQDVLRLRRAVYLHSEGLGAAGSEQRRHHRLDLFALVLGEGDPAPLAERVEQLHAFDGGGGGEDRYFDVDATRALEVDLDQIGATGGKDPDDPSSVGRVAHLLGEHRVDSAGEG